MIIGIDANEANLTDKRVGVNQYAFELLWAIYNLQSEHQFIIYLKNQPRADLPHEKESFKYRVIPFPKLWTQTRLPFDLYFHFPRPDVFFSMGHYAPRFSPIPTVVAIMDLGFLEAPEQFTSKDFNQLKSWTEYSVKNGTKIVTISDFTKQKVIEVYGKKDTDVTTTLLSYNEKLFVPTHNNNVLKKYGISKPYFLFLGSLKPNKNIESLIRAFDRLDDQYQLVIAGKKAWLFGEIFKTVEELRLQDRVVFTDFIEEWEKPVLMTESIAFVLPSLYEGFGIPVLEAMACNTPVVVSAVASLPEVAGDAGVYIEPKSIDSITAGMQKAVTDHDKFVKLGQKRVKLFSWAKCAQETILCLQTATAKN